MTGSFAYPVVNHAVEDIGELFEFRAEDASAFAAEVNKAFSERSFRLLTPGRTVADAYCWSCTLVEVTVDHDGVDIVIEKEISMRGTLPVRTAMKPRFAFDPQHGLYLLTGEPSRPYVNRQEHFLWYNNQPLKPPQERLQAGELQHS